MNGDCGNFECSICLDLAQEPIVTRCGHLFCWPCIWKWLRMHSKSHECPICKAYIKEGKLVPLYGRGKNSADSTSKLGGNIPKRPASQKPKSGQHANRNAYVPHGSGFICGFGPAITLSFGNIMLSFGGFIPSVFNFQMHPFNYRGHHDVVQQQREHHHEVSPILIIGLLFLFALVWE